MRKSFLVAAITTLAVITVGASSAQAFVVRSGNAASGVPVGTVCPAVQISGNTVTGGCLIQAMQGPWLLAQGSDIFTSCTAFFSFRIDGSATVVYAINQTASCAGLPRRECRDDSTGQKIPWPNPQMSMCIEHGDGGPDNWATISWSFTLGASGQLIKMTQVAPTSPNWAGIGNAEFTNGGTANNEVLITTN